MVVVVLVLAALLVQMVVTPPGNLQVVCEVPLLLVEVDAVEDDDDVLESAGAPAGEGKESGRALRMTSGVCAAPTAACISLAFELVVRILLPLATTGFDLGLKFSCEEDLPTAVICVVMATLALRTLTELPAGFDGFAFMTGPGDGELGLEDWRIFTAQAVPRRTAALSTSIWGPE